MVGADIAEIEASPFPNAASGASEAANTVPAEAASQS
jgi:hypothetical protein